VTSPGIALMALDEDLSRRRLRREKAFITFPLRSTGGFIHELATLQRATPP